MRARTFAVFASLVACADNPSGPGGASATSSSTSAGTTVSQGSSSRSTGTGSGGDAEWTVVPWWAGPCAFEYAKKPERGFPVLAWTACPANEAGCERFDKTWPQQGPSGLSSPSVRLAGPGQYELTVGVSYPEFEKRIPFFSGTGVPIAVYRTPPNSLCTNVQPGLADDGHWVGQQDVGHPSVYAFQPNGLDPTAAVLSPNVTASQLQRGRGTLLATQRDLGAGIDIFDRTTLQVHASPVALVGAEIPHLFGDAAVFLGFPAYNKPEAWIWTRAGGTYRKLLDKNPRHVIDVQSDGTTLVWIETPPATVDGDWPAGDLYTSPHTSDAAAVVPTARRALPKIPLGAPSAIGGGHYAVYSAYTNRIYVIRLSDARQWTVPVPVDEWQSLLNDVTYVDDDVLFYKTGTNVYKQRLDVLGPGEAP